MIIPLTAGLLWKASLFKMSYFQEPYNHSKSKISIAIAIDTSKFAKKVI